MAAVGDSAPSAGGMSNGKQQHQDDKHGAPRQPHIPYTFILIVLLCMSAILANVLTYSFTVTQFHSYGNGSEADFYNVFDYREVDSGAASPTGSEINNIYDDTPAEASRKWHQIVNITIHRRRFLSNPQKESLILVASIGSLLALFPIAYLYRVYGFSRIFVSCGVLSVLCSLTLPKITNAQTFALAAIVHILQGCPLAAFLPVIAKISSYLSIEEFTFNSVLLFSYLQISAFITFPIAGLLSVSPLGWHSVHYGCCIGTALLFVVYTVYHRSEGYRRTVRQSRLFEVFYGTTAEHHSSSILTLHLPYLSIYQDIAVWGTLVAGFGYFCAQQLALQYAPLFLAKVANYDTIPTALLTALPPFVSFVLMIVTALKYPKLPLLRENTLLRMRVFNSIASVMPGVCFIVLAFFDPDDNPGLVTILYVAGASLLGFSGGGFFASIRRRAGKFSIFIVANLHAVCYVAMFTIGLMNVLISRNEEYNEWKALFIVHGVVLIVCNVVFCLFVTTERAEWSKEGYQDTSFGPKRADPLPQFPL